MPKPGPASIASKLLKAGQTSSNGPETVDADDWIDHPAASDYALMEDSVAARTGMVLTLLWWNDERQILDLDED